MSDAVAALADLALCLPFERTTGDEMQAVSTTRPRCPRRRTPAPGRDLAHRHRGRDRREPLPDNARAGRGPAYLHARSAVTTAKNSPWHLRVVGDDGAARELETVLWLWAGVLGRRTDKGWEVADLVDQGLSYDEAAGPARHQPVGRQPARPGGRAWSRDGARPSWSTELAARLLGKDDVNGTGRPGHDPRSSRSACALGGWSARARRIWAPAHLVLLITAGILAAAPPEVIVEGDGATTRLVLTGGLLAMPAAAR